MYLCMRHVNYFKNYNKLQKFWLVATLWMFESTEFSFSAGIYSWYILVMVIILMRGELVSLILTWLWTSVWVLVAHCGSRGENISKEAELEFSLGLVEQLVMFDQHFIVFGQYLIIFLSYWIIVRHKWQLYTWFGLGQISHHPLVNILLVFDHVWLVFDHILSLSNHCKIYPFYKRQL